MSEHVEKLLGNGRSAHVYSQPLMIEHNVSLRPYNTFGLDVKARALARIRSVDGLRETLEERNATDGLFILGGGSNILFTKDVDGLVLKNELEGIDVTHRGDADIIVKAGAGTVWHQLVMHCVNNGWGGIENLSLIPGNVGAAPMQNIGAYGVELKDVFHSLEAVHIETGELHTFMADDCAFGYRESVFKRTLKNQYVISSVSLRLNLRHTVNTSYGAIGNELEAMGVESPTIKDVSQAVINIRRSKLPDPAELGNAGSFFKNPVVTEELAAQLLRAYPDVPCYPADGGCKLAAGWLIERCGWKGKIVGNTGSHAKQALVLVNYGNASGKEIFQLSEDIMRSVSATFGVQLEREVNVH